MSVAVDVREKWRLVGFSLLHLCVDGAGFESTLTARMAMLLSGLPYADLNMAVLWGGGDLEWMRVRSEFRRVPCLVLAAGSVGAGGAGAACELAGLVAAGEIPLMRLACGGAGESGDGSVFSGDCGLAESDAEVVSANAVTGAAFGLPLAAVNAVFGGVLSCQPGLRVYVVRHEGLVVSGLRVSRIGETAVIWCMATAAAQQRRGFGRRVLSAAIAAERATGASEFLLLATPAGQPLYRSVGFEVVAVASGWLQGGEFALGEGVSGEGVSVLHE
jgi:ribosomal protein S18 acetylase RimI-like enzyme